MTSTIANKLAPLATPIPAFTGQDPWTPAQWTTFFSFMDTVIPSIQRNSSTSDTKSHLTVSSEKYNETVKHIREKVVTDLDDAALDQYFGERATDIPEFKELLRRNICYYVPSKGQRGLGFILTALNNYIGSRLLTGYTTPFHEQPIHIRQSILESWRESYLPTLNLLYKQITSLGKVTWLKTSPNFSKLSGFPRTPDHYKPGQHYEFKFEHFEAGSEPEVVEADVVIVGSGCGGAVCANNLAAAGYRVLVVDKGYYFPPSQLPMSQSEAGVHILENGGVDVSEDGSTTLVTGATWGGGGTVNWSASLQTQSFVRKEWADAGLTFFETAEFQNCLDRVCDRMGVSTDFIEHNHTNQILLEGARKLGYTAKDVPQNTGGAAHNCGHCMLGCGSAQKQGPVMTWLPDAAKAGAKFVEGFKVDHVIFDESSGVKKATGVQGVWTGRDSHGGVDGPASERTVRKMIINAKKVILSCGTMWSPVVLLNSGLTNHQIGRNLRMHPVNFAFGVFPEDVRPWEGPILTTVCTTLENQDGKGHGVKLEATCMLPSFSLVVLNWENALNYKTLALKFRHMSGFISICRERDSGRVWVDPKTGRPRLDYTPSAFDRNHMMEGIVALAKMLYVTGASEIHAAITGVPPFIRKDASKPEAEHEEQETDPGITSPDFQAWLANLRAVGNKPIAATFSCAHQMGTCRMSTKEHNGVVDPKGKVWGVEDLYVADASVFPSASGVNPMVTNMAISDFISRELIRTMKREKGESS